MRSVSFKNSLTTRALRREALQLGIIAAITAGALLLDSRALQVIAGIVDAAMCVIAALALVVAWRVSGRAGALVVYATAAVIFASLAVLNLRG
jgi:hypothetical protein